MLVQTTAVCFVLLLVALLYCRNYLVEMMREYTSLSPAGISRDGLIRQVPRMGITSRSLGFDT